MQVESGAGWGRGFVWTPDCIYPRRSALGPIRWRNRQVREIEGLRAQLPTEKRRHERFVDACDQFGAALLLRIAELEEPGKNSDQAHILALRKLYLDMRRCAKADPSE